MLLFGNPMITHSTVMFRREEYNRKGYSYERFVQAHDYKLWTQFIMDNKKIEIIPKILLDYRINESGITATNTQVRNKIEADTIKKEYVMGMELDEKSKKTLLEYNFCPLFLFEEAEARIIQVSVQVCTASIRHSQSLHDF